MAQQPITHKESPEKDVRHADRTEATPRSTLPPFDSGEPRPGQVGSNVFPSSFVTPDPQIGEAQGVPMIKLAPYPGTTAKYTISDVISNKQAEDAGQAPPKPDLPPEAVKKAKLMGIVEVSDEERQALVKEAAAASRTRATGAPVSPTGVVHPTAHGEAHAQSPMHGVGKTADEAATQAKYDNRGGGEK